MELLTDTVHGVLKPTNKGLRPGVIGVVEGIFGVMEENNRNGRRYTKDLWEKVIQDPETQSKLKNRSIYGEADHPEGLYAGIARASHVVTSLELREREDGKPIVWGTAELLDTPTGRILKTLFDAGCSVGISSRGSGSLLDDVNSGNKVVSKEDYIYGGHDFVSEPACAGSYPKLTSEVVASIKQVVAESADKVLTDKPYYTKLLEGFGVAHVLNSVISEEVDTERKEVVVKAAQASARKGDNNAGVAYSEWVGDKEKDLNTEKTIFMAEYNKEVGIMKAEEAKQKAADKTKESSEVNKESVECLTKALDIIDDLNRGLDSENRTNTINLVKESEVKIRDLKKRIKGLVKRKKSYSEGVADSLKFEISVLKGLLAQKKDSLNEALDRIDVLERENGLLLKESKKIKKIRNIYIQESGRLGVELQKYHKLLEDNKSKSEKIIEGLNKDLDVLVEDVQSNTNSNGKLVADLQAQVNSLQKENLNLTIQSVALQYGVSQNKLRKVMKEDVSYSYNEIVDIAKEFAGSVSRREGLPDFEDLKESVVGVEVVGSQEDKKRDAISSRISKMVSKMR